MTIVRQAEIINLLYAELLQQCWKIVPNKTISYFKRNNNKWYVQLMLGKHKTEYCLGLDSPELQNKLEAEKQLQKNNATPEVQTRQRLVAMLIAGGAQTVSPVEAKVLASLERIGVFLVGGVLIGSHAFRLYENMLGVHWPNKAIQTKDIDIASDNVFKVGVANTPIDLQQALLQAGLSFFPVPPLNYKQPSTKFRLHNCELQIDILTPLPAHYPPDKGPIILKSLNTAAEPVAFLDFLLEDYQSAVVIAKAGIVVNIPAPARFALHKLVLSQRRPPAWQVKARKDIEQATQLLEVLLEDRPGDIILAKEAALSMSKKFQQQLQLGIEKLNQDLQAQLMALI